jgi:hypothetical protein
MIMITRSNTVSVSARHRQHPQASHIPNPQPTATGPPPTPAQRLDTTYRQVDNTAEAERQFGRALTLSERTIGSIERRSYSRARASLPNPPAAVHRPALSSVNTAALSVTDSARRRLLGPVEGVGAFRIRGDQAL